MYYALPKEMLESEYLEEEPHDLRRVARSASGVSTLHDAAGDDLHASTRWRQNMELGGDQEAIVATRTRDGDGLGRHRRSTGSPAGRCSDTEELAFLAAAAPRIGEGARAGPADRRGPRAGGPAGAGARSCCRPSSSWSPRPRGRTRGSTTYPAAAGRRPPPAAVRGRRGARAASSAGRDRPGEVALSRVLSRSGTWVVLHGATLAGTDEPRVAVILEPAHPARIVPLLMAAYGLTDREQEVTRLVLQGESTAGIAGRLVVSPHTVQEHLKHIFDKTGVRSRRDLVGKVFFAHYEPRLRDNEQRVARRPPAARRSGAHVTVPRFGVVGAGILGLAIARRLLELVPDATVTVLEKEQRVAAHQTGRNSGVVHAGLYYAPGSLKATLCRRGMTLLRELCHERGLAYEECGKLVVARDEREVGRLARHRGARDAPTGFPACAGSKGRRCGRSSRTSPASPRCTRRTRRSWISPPSPARSRQT